MAVGSPAAMVVRADDGQATSDRLAGPPEQRKVEASEAAPDRGILTRVDSSVATIDPEEAAPPALATAPAESDMDDAPDASTDADAPAGGVSPAAEVDTAAHETGDEADVSEADAESRSSYIADPDSAS